MSGTNSGKSRSRIHWPKRSELLHLPDVVPHVDVHVVLGRPGTGHRVAQRGWARRSRLPDTSPAHHPSRVADDRVADDLRRVVMHRLGVCHQPRDQQHDRGDARRHERHQFSGVWSCHLITEVPSDVRVRFHTPSRHSRSLPWPRPRVATTRQYARSGCPASSCGTGESNASCPVAARLFWGSI
jgi:hypothetical protein